MTERVITCINCPMGCRVTVRLEGSEIVDVSGYTCKRGDTYARQECVEPLRMVTAVIPVEGSVCPLSVKTASPIPKAKIAEAMRALGDLRLTAPITAGTAVLKNVCGTGVDVIATRTV
ncbi:MAG: DUF1667 domain-containing protein [Clostridia bacterium]|nr:DUF1667 domain-containing protein [Clostridia bacterium]